MARHDESRLERRTKEGKGLRGNYPDQKQRAMLETRQLIQSTVSQARELDQMLVENGRRSIVRHNLCQLEGRQRSEKYAARLAGISDDVQRKSVTERALEWYGATVLEDPVRASLVSEFWRPLLVEYPQGRPLIALGSFWQADEDVATILAHARQAVVGGDRLTAKFHIVQARQKLADALRLIDAEEAMLR